MYLTLRIGAGAFAAAALFALTWLFGPIVPVLAALALMALATFRMAAKPRKPWMHAGLPTVLLVAVFSPSAVFAATIDVGQAVTGSLVDIINGAVAAGITALVAWVAMVIKNKFNIDIEAKHREALTAFLNRQASSLVAKGAVKVQGLKVEVSSDALAVAANTALHAVPDALKFFGLTPESLQKRILDLLPQQPAIAQAQAIALDVANPTTPSMPAPTIAAGRVT